MTNTLPDLESISDSETDSDPAPSMSDIQDEDGNTPLFNTDGEFTEFLVLPSCPTKNPDFYDTVETNNCVYSTVQYRIDTTTTEYCTPPRRRLRLRKHCTSFFYGIPATLLCPRRHHLPAPVQVLP